MFRSSRKLPRIPQPGPRTTSCWCSTHQHTSLAVDAASEALVCVPAARFTVDHASSNKYRTLGITPRINIFFALRVDCGKL
jgi:hypothetical protein